MRERVKERKREIERETERKSEKEEHFSCQTIKISLVPNISHKKWNFAWLASSKEAMESLLNTEIPEERSKEVSILAAYREVKHTQEMIPFGQASQQPNYMRNI